MCCIPLVEERNITPSLPPQGDRPVDNSSRSSSSSSSSSDSGSSSSGTFIEKLNKLMSRLVIDMYALLASANC